MPRPKTETIAFLTSDEIARLFHAPSLGLFIAFVFGRMIDEILRTQTEQAAVATSSEMNCPAGST
jgi:hypothetical protein